MSQMGLGKLSLAIEGTNTFNQLNMNYFIKYITNLVNIIQLYFNSHIIYICNNRFIANYIQ